VPPEQNTRLQATVCVLENFFFENYNQMLAEPVLTVYFGTPSMFITLWFGFDY
jgi:hypothetical protein